MRASSPGRRYRATTPWKKGEGGWGESHKHTTQFGKVCGPLLNHGESTE